MLYIKFGGNRFSVSGKEDFEAFYHAANKLSFPLPKEDRHKIGFD